MIFFGLLRGKLPPFCLPGDSLHEKIDAQADEGQAEKETDE
jgi:hypothetical protein